jgi:PhnB protein
MAMFKVNIGASFPGTCEQAFQFYKSVFGGEFLEFLRIGDDPYTKANSPKEEHGKVAFVDLQLGNVIFGAADAPADAVNSLVAGNMLSISVQPDSKAEADRIFKGLAEGAKVVTKMTDYPWGYIGSVTDKFGISWGVWYIPPPPGKLE